MAKLKKYLIPIPSEVERALKHAAIARGLTVAQTIVAAITEMAQRDGWLATVVTSDKPEVSP